jgi:hypothetical protein
VIPHRLRALAWVALLLFGIALRTPALRVGRLGDDWYHLAMLEGTYPVTRSVTNLYDFVRDDPREHAALRDRGVFPWWTTPSLKLSPWRPLASALLALDHTLFGRDPVGPHGVSLAAWALLLVAAACWFRALLPEGAALLALALLVLDEAVTVPVAWIANRASLLATALGLFGAGLLARTRGRRDLRTLAAVAGFFSLSVASGEYGLAVTGGAVTHELLVDPELRREGRLRLVAALAPALVYVVAWKVLGHGARGTTAYVDPFSQPGLWVSTARDRALAFLGELTCALPIETTRAHPAATFVALILAATLTALVLSRAPDHGRRRVLALLGATAVALVPELSAPLNGRVLLPVVPFWSAALAALLESVRPTDRERLPRYLRGALALWALVHLAVPFVRGANELRSLAAWQPTTLPWRALPGVDACRSAGQTHVLLAAGDFGRLHTAGLYWQSRGCVQPDAWRVLAAPAGGAIVLREGLHSLELRAPDDAPVITGHGLLWRLAPPFREGERFHVTGMDVEIRAVRAGQPTRIRYTFEHSLDDPRMVFWMATDVGFEQVAPPPVGRGRFVPATTTHFW